MASLKRFRFIWLAIPLTLISMLVYAIWIHPYEMESPIRSGDWSNSTDVPGHEPGPVDVSTMAPGHQFEATPNFYFTRTCIHPCWLPTYTEPRLIFARSITDGFPQERLGAFGDTVRVVCQVRGERIANIVGGSSDIWDRLAVPRGETGRERDTLEGTIDKQWFYAYGSDLYLGNTGWHGIPCPPP